MCVILINVQMLKGTDGNKMFPDDKLRDTI